MAAAFYSSGHPEKMTAISLLRILTMQIILYFYILNILWTDKTKVKLFQ